MYQNYDLKHTIESYWIEPEWLANRMLFLSGPRQVGKTTLVKARLCLEDGGYYNWDNRKVRLAFQRDPDFFIQTKSPWICFDEIHKRPKWKDILKGVYDSYKERFRFVVTGSARLETFKKSGDSLFGRYFHTHLFPLNLSDFAQTNFSPPTSPEQLLESCADLNTESPLEALLTYSGFPEPFYKTSEVFYKRWAAQHHDLILTEDLRELSRVMEIDKITHLLEMLVPNVCQPVSNQGLATDLETAPVSIKRWLEMLSRVQLIFPVAPYTTKIRRGYVTAKKWYFMDWCAAQGNIFENYVACSLWRAVTLYNDRYGEKMSLNFVRTYDGSEVDFLVCRDGRPWLLVEAKEGSPEVSNAVYRFSHELKVPCAVVTRRKNIFMKKKGDQGQKIFCVSWGKLGQLLP